MIQATTWEWKLVWAILGALLLLLLYALYLDMIYRFGMLSWSDANTAPAAQKPASLSSSVDHAVVQNNHPVKVVYQQLGNGNVMNVGAPVTLGKGGVTRQTARYKSRTGATATIDIYLVYASAAWKKGSPAQFEHPEEVRRFFDSSDFASALSLNQALIAVGLASNSGYASANQEDAELLSLQRGLTLCTIMSARSRFGTPLLFGIGLGYSLEPIDEPDRRRADAHDSRQRPLVVLGVRAATGDLGTTDGRSAMIRRMLDGGTFVGFNPKEYSVIIRSRPMDWIDLSRVDDR